MGVNRLVMKENSQNNPTADKFTQASIQKHLLSEAFQHPATLYFGAAALLGSLYMGFIQFGEPVFVFTLGTGMCSAMSVVYQYFIRGDELAKKYVQKLLEQRKKHGEEQGTTIIVQCRDNQFQEGKQAAEELIIAFNRLEKFLKEKMNRKKTATAQRFLLLAEENYNQGVRFLNKALFLYQALKEIDAKKFFAELKKWEKELQYLKQTSDNADEGKERVVRAYEEKIRSHKKRLELYTERKKLLEQLLAECEVIEATLDTAYLEVVDLIEDEASLVQRDVAGNLERAVNAARKVEERLRGMKSAPSAEDAQYDH